MTEFKKGDRIVFVEDDEHGGVEMPKGTLATYDDDDPINIAPSVLLDSGERVLAWRTCIDHAEDHGTGDGSASDVCAEPGCNCDLERCTAPLDPAKVKPGATVTVLVENSRPDVPSYTVSGQVHSDPTGRPWVGPLALASDYSGGPLTLTLTDHQPAPEPEPYVPDLKHIRSAYVDARHDNDIITSQEAEAEFDRWMATHVVIDPATVDVANIVKVAKDFWQFSPKADGVHPVEIGVREALRSLGIEVPR